MADLKDMLWDESHIVLNIFVGRTIARIDWPTANQIRWTFTDGASTTLQWTEAIEWSELTYEPAQLQFYFDEVKPNG